MKKKKARIGSFGTPGKGEIEQSLMFSAELLGGGAVGAIGSIAAIKYTPETTVKKLTLDYILAAVGAAALLLPPSYGGIPSVKAAGLCMGVVAGVDIYLRKFATPAAALGAHRHQRSYKVAGAQGNPVLQGPQGNPVMQGLDKGGLAEQSSPSFDRAFRMAQA